MNLQAGIITALGTAFMFYVYGEYQHHVGWNEGRQNLVEQQAEQARAKLARQTIRQQADDTKAAAADDEGKTKTITITQEVVKYVKTPGRNVCTFDGARVLLKSHAVDNANNLAGYDDAAVQTPAAVGQR